MPAKSKKQQRFAAMSASPKGRKVLQAKGRKPMPIAAAKDFRKTAKPFGKLPLRVKAKRRNR
jgi:hypothetical protein